MTTMINNPQLTATGGNAIAAAMTDTSGEIVERQLAHLDDADLLHAEGVRKALFGRNQPQVKQCAIDLIPA
jgi:hypothetical protein